MLLQVPRRSPASASSIVEGYRAAQIEQYKQARIVDVSPARVNREVALLKHMFNLAQRWGALRGTNPVRMVKFFDEDVVRVLSLEEEGCLLSHCSPYVQDLILFAIDTGPRAGDILNLKWEEVDLETSVIIRKVRKNRKRLEIPLNDVAQRVVHAWQA